MKTLLFRTSSRRSVLLLSVLIVVSAAANTAPKGTPVRPTAAPPPPKPAVHQATVVAPQEDMALAVDAAVKEFTARPDQESHTFTFAVKNVSTADVIIQQVRTSCGCTVAKLPAQPWTLKPGAGGDIQLEFDLRGKTGLLVKTATIDTQKGFKTLTLKVTRPDYDGNATAEQIRARNQELAKLDRQAVFKGDCARCHVEPARGQRGMGLYVTACAICHDAEHRGSMVPDLRALNKPTDREYWRTFTVHGKAGTLMPAFGAEHGGPLTTEQIESLVDYLAGEFSGRLPDARTTPNPVAPPKK